MLTRGGASVSVSEVEGRGVNILVSLLINGVEVVNYMGFRYIASRDQKLNFGRAHKRSLYKSSLKRAIDIGI